MYMQLYHSFHAEDMSVIDVGLRCMILAATPQTAFAGHLERLSSNVEFESELYTALSAIVDDPGGYDLLLVDCDSFSDHEIGQVAVATLRAVQSRVAVILVSTRYEEQSFPQSRHEPICLRAPLSALSLRVGVEHAIRDRLLWAARTSAA